MLVGPLHSHATALIAQHGTRLYISTGREGRRGNGESANIKSMKIEGQAALQIRGSKIKGSGGGTKIGCGGIQLD